MNGDYFDGQGRGYDPETVKFFDVAHEGAQIRNIANALDGLWTLEGMRAHSVVVITTDPVARAAAEFAMALHTPLHHAVVMTETLPLYVGALDVVVVITDHGDDADRARDILTAAGRGATCVLIGPAQGPLLDDIDGQALVIPSLPTAAGPSPARTIAAVDMMLRILCGDVELLDHKLEEAASAVDMEIEALSPERDVTVNPGRQLREFVDGARIVHSGRGVAGAALARAAAALWTARGLSSGYVDYASLPEALGDQAEAVADIFHDPYLDGGESMVPLRGIIWGDEATQLPRCQAVPPSTTGLKGSLSLIVRAYAVPTYSLDA